MLINETFEVSFENSKSYVVNGNNFYWFVGNQNQNFICILDRIIAFNCDCSFTNVCCNSKWQLFFPDSYIWFVISLFCRLCCHETGKDVLYPQLFLKSIRIFYLIYQLNSVHKHEIKVCCWILMSFSNILFITREKS